MGEMADDALDRAAKEIEIYEEFRDSPVEILLENGLCDAFGNVYEPTFTLEGTFTGRLR